MGVSERNAPHLGPILRIRVGPVFYRGNFEGPFEEGTVCGIAPDLGGRKGEEPELDMRTDLPADISFADGAPMFGVSVRPALMRVRDHIADEVLPALEPLLS